MREARTAEPLCDYFISNLRNRTPGGKAVRLLDEVVQPLTTSKFDARTG